MSEVNRYWVPHNVLADQSGWHQDDNEVVLAGEHDVALAALREELAKYKQAVGELKLTGDYHADVNALLVEAVTARRLQASVEQSLENRTDRVAELADERNKLQQLLAAAQSELASLREELATANGCLEEWRRSKLGQTITENMDLRKALTAAEQRNEDLTQALKFYADRDHYCTDDGLNWDSCSGEPSNILWHEEQPWFIEDGSVARAALKPTESGASHVDCGQCPNITDGCLGTCQKVKP